MANFKNTQFDYLFSAIADKFPAIAEHNNSTQFQFTGSPMEAAWTNSTDMSAYNTANRVSAAVNGFYTPNPGSLFTAYRSLIASIDPGVDGSKDPTYVKLQKQLTDARASVDSALSKAKVGWATYKSQNTNAKTGLPDETQSVWLKDELGGLQFQNAIDIANDKVEKLTANLALLTASFNAALAEAQEALTAKENQSIYSTPGGGTETLPTITLAGDLGADVSNWDAYPADQYDLDVQLTKDSVVKSPWTTVYRSNIEQHCFSTSVSSSVNTSRIISDQHYKLEVKIKGFKSYTMSFGNWYDASFVNPATAKFSPAANVNSQTFFGKDSGSLHLIPSQIWVMYQPSITLTISTEMYKQEIEGALKSSINWLDLLTFRFDISAGTSLAKVGETTTVLTFDAPVLQSPQIFGVTSIVEVVS